MQIGEIPDNFDNRIKAPAKRKRPTSAEKSPGGYFIPLVGLFLSSVGFAIRSMLIGMSGFFTVFPD